ncbi:Protein kinase-like domain containing protein [Rhypophila decipiens]
MAIGKTLYSKCPSNYSLKDEAYTVKKEITAYKTALAKFHKGGHIIKLLLTLEYGGHHYLLFEWADGTLDGFWEKGRMKASPEAEKWLARQCFGLASALKQIHGQATWQRANRSNEELSPAGDAVALDDGEYRLHGYIKPQNILWFSRYGTDGTQKDHMVISGLGITRYHTSLTPPRVTWPKPKNDSYSKAYRAPEMDLDNPMVSRKFDIWSLGCVFLEFCTWYLEGMDGIARFAMEREEGDDTNVDRLKDSTFFRIKMTAEGAKIAEIKTTVTNAHTPLQQQCRCEAHSRHYQD